MHRLFLRVTFCLLWLTAAGVSGAGKTEAPPAKAVALMDGYRTNVAVEARLAAIRGLEKYRGAAVDDFLLAEYAKLDSSKEADARLLGGFFRTWAAHPTPAVLPFLIYEGLFHDDAEVVRACAAGIVEEPEAAKVAMSTGTAARGTDPGEELAKDLLARLEERPDVLPALEKVLVLWSGKTRPGYVRGSSLKRKVDEKEHAAAVEFWKGWFQQRFKKKPAPGGKK